MSEFFLIDEYFVPCKNVIVSCTFIAVCTMYATGRCTNERSDADLVDKFHGKATRCSLFVRRRRLLLLLRFFRYLVLLGRRRRRRNVRRRCRAKVADRLRLNDASSRSRTAEFRRHAVTVQYCGRVLFVGHGVVPAGVLRLCLLRRSEEARTSPLVLVLVLLLVFSIKYVHVYSPQRMQKYTESSRTQNVKKPCLH